MPKKFPPEFKRDAVTVARRGDRTRAEVEILRATAYFARDAERRGEIESTPPTHENPHGI
jgi:hypothetical protein